MLPDPEHSMPARALTLWCAFLSRNNNPSSLTSAAPLHGNQLDIRHLPAVSQELSRHALFVATSVDTWRTLTQKVRQTHNGLKKHMPNLYIKHHSAGLTQW